MAFCLDLRFDRLLTIRHSSKVFWFDRELLNLSLTLTKQSLLKHVLTEGDKMLVSALSSDKDQGVYALVVNYGKTLLPTSFPIIICLLHDADVALINFSFIGSLIVRILFGPLEETVRTLFSKLLSDIGDKPLTKSQSHVLETSARILTTIFKFHILLGLVFTCFATNYTATLIDLLVGSIWSKGTNAPTVLAFYCVYVPVMGINGVSEAFVQAVATEQQLARLSKFMIIFSLIFVCSGVLFMHFMHLGAIGLVLANIVNLGSRIAYSWIFIRDYFLSKRGDNLGKVKQMITLRSWLPSKVVLLAFGSGWAVTRLSEELIGWTTLREKAIHIAVGGVAAILTMGSM
jgi:oligosaccharide translocation protein RFT1